MADLDLNELSDKEIDALQSAINRKKRQRIDWDNMTHEERAMWNKTIEPRTHKTVHYEYPKTIYGKFADNTVKSATIKNAQEEAAVRRSDPPADWQENLLAHGIETCPSPPDQAKSAGFVTVGIARPVAVPDPVPVPMVEEHPAAVAARRGRPPKNQEAA